jgi:hypothetical protein
MWRLLALTARNPDIARSDFAPALLHTLAPAIAAAPAAGKGLERLVIKLAPGEVSAAVAEIFPARFDALLEFWFADGAAAVTTLNGLSRDSRVLASAAHLLQADRGVAWLAEVFAKKLELGRTRIKFLAGGQQAEGWTVARAQAYWSEVHPQVAQTAPLVWEPLTRYTQFHGREAPGLDIGTWLAVPRFVPMCAEMGFAQERDFLSTYTNEQYLSIVRPDEEKFSRPGEMLSFVSEQEHEFTPI